MEFLIFFINYISIKSFYQILFMNLIQFKLIVIYAIFSFNIFIKFELKD